MDDKIECENFDICGLVKIWMLKNLLEQNAITCVFGTQMGDASPF